MIFFCFKSEFLLKTLDFDFSKENESFKDEIIFIFVIFQIGNDMFGDKNLEGLKKEGICVDGIEKSNSAQTATATITVNKEG